MPKAVDYKEFELLEQEIARGYCDPHFQGWKWLLESKGDTPENRENLKTMLQKAINDRRMGERLNLSYWYKVWYGKGYGNSTTYEDPFRTKFGFKEGQY